MKSSTGHGRKTIFRLGACWSASHVNVRQWHATMKPRIRDKTGRIFHLILQYAGSLGRQQSGFQGALAEASGDLHLNPDIIT